MDIYVRVLGLDLFSLHLSTAAPEHEVASDEPGDCLSTPIGFMGTLEAPDMAGPYREGWE